MRKITEIIIHCTATPDGKNFTVADIDRWHRERGWQGIGYHYVIYRDGTVHPGRPLRQPGAHCLEHNANSIGVCYVGGMSSDGKIARDTRTPKQRAALLQLVAELMAKYPGSTVHGHNEFSAKACPSFDVQTEL